MSVRIYGHRRIHVDIVEIHKGFEGDEQPGYIRLIVSSEIEVMKKSNMIY